MPVLLQLSPNICWVECSEAGLGACWHSQGDFCFFVLEKSTRIGLGGIASTGERDLCSFFFLFLGLHHD